MSTRSQIEELETKLSSLREQEREEQSRKFVTCGKCKKKSQIKKTTYIQTHWYVSPHG